MDDTRGKVLLTVQQISFAKLLASNDKRTRDKGLSKLRRYFPSRSEGLQTFSEDDFMRIWKGLYYCMWMSDKPLVQEELAENISSLIHCLKQTDPAVLFIQSFFLTMGVEWYGIDQHRLDKFLMLVRRFLRHALVYCHQKNWDEVLVNKMTSAFSSTVLSSSPRTRFRPPQLGFTLHFIDIFLEELAKVSKGKLPEHILLKFIQMFLQPLVEQDEPRIRSHIVQHIFHHLLKQSDMGIEYEERFAAWQQAGFPGESWEDMEKVDDSSDDNGSDDENQFNEQDLDSNIKDPRAGKVDVILPQINFHAEKMAALILEYSRKATVLKCRKVLLQLAEQFGEMAKGSYPLAFKLKIPEGSFGKKKRKKKNLWKAAEDLMFVEEFPDGDELDKSHGRKRKHIEIESDSSEIIPPKVKKLELKLRRCDQFNKNNKAKLGKQNAPKASKTIVSNGHRGINETDDSANGMLCKDKVHLKKLKLRSLEQKTKVVLQKKRVSLEHKNCVKLEERSVTPKKIPLKNLQIHLSRWEVTDVCNKTNQDSPATEASVQLQGIKMLSTPKNTQHEAEIQNTTKPIVTTSTPQTLSKHLGKRLSMNGASGSSKKVNIALQMNKEQKISDYVKAVKESPTIPFDATRKPLQGVLKPSPISSPINPFHRRSRRKLLP